MSVIQQLPYTVGSRVRVKNVHGGYALPAGLPEGAQVVVVEKVPGTITVEYLGRRYEVPMACIDSGFRVIGPGSSALSSEERLRRFREFTKKIKARSGTPADDSRESIYED